MSADDVVMCSNQSVGTTVSASVVAYQMLDGSMLRRGRTLLQTAEPGVCILKDRRPRLAIEGTPESPAKITSAGAPACGQCAPIRAAQNGSRICIDQEIDRKKRLEEFERNPAMQGVTDIDIIDDENIPVELAQEAAALFALQRIA